MLRDNDESHRRTGQSRCCCRRYTHVHSRVWQAVPAPRLRAMQSNQDVGITIDLVPGELGEVHRFALCGSEPNRWLFLAPHATTYAQNLPVFDGAAMARCEMALS